LVEYVAWLRTGKEALVARMREQCREVERAKFEQGKQIVEEDESMRAMHVVRSCFPRPASEQICGAVYRGAIVVPKY
jgi:hypothetical protein